MHLRTRVVLSIVAVAAAAAGVRALHPAAPQVASPFAVDAPPFPQATRTRTAADFRPGSTSSVVVYVAGEVMRSGIYTLPSTARAIDALRAAGGAKRDADLVAVDLAQPLSDGDEVAVPALGEAANAHGAHGKRSRARGHHHRRRRHRLATSVAAGPDGISREQDGAEPPVRAVDINTASADVIATLPGIGERLAERIVMFRETNGPFSSLDDLLDVNGMSAGKLDALSPYAGVR